MNIHGQNQQLPLIYLRRGHFFREAVAWEGCKASPKLPGGRNWGPRPGELLIPGTSGCNSSAGTHVAAGLHISLFRWHKYVPGFVCHQRVVYRLNHLALVFPTTLLYSRVAKTAFSRTAPEGLWSPLPYLERGLNRHSFHPLALIIASWTKYPETLLFLFIIIITFSQSEKKF